jgi:hypothetical protein
MQRSRLFILCCLFLLLVGGCGGASKAPPAAFGGAGSERYGTTSVASSPRPAEKSASSDDSYAPPMPAAPPSTTSAGPSRESRAESAPPATTPAPRDRPGLGTEWGETRESRVRDVTFTRADDDRPFAIAAMHYNDRAGVDALARYHHSNGPSFREYSARGGAITISVRNGSGTPLEAMHIADRTYVIGQTGERYSIVLVNHTAHRFEAVATVDGLDVINGKPGDLAYRGYVLLPYATLEIDGFRQSHDAVAAFRFAKVSDSYAAETGSARNVGVIGVAFFGERGDAYSEDELHTRDTASPFPGSDPRFARPPSR